MSFNINKIKEQQQLLTEYLYELVPIERGYNKRTLAINLSTNMIHEKKVSEEMIEKFVGGKGFDLKLLWDAVTPTTKWNDPLNAICFATGPLCGNTSYPGSGKTIVTTLSPLTNIPIDSNVGGFFGSYLKFSGFDALEISGKANNEVIIYIDGNQGQIYIFAASQEHHDSHILAEQLHEIFADNEQDKMNISVVSAGSASDHVYMGILNFSFYDLRRKIPRLKQAGRGGIGHVFRDKKIRALVVKYSGTNVDMNSAADLHTLKKTGLKMHQQIKKLDASQFRMRQVGTANIVNVMNDYDLLPVKNFKYGSHPEAAKIHSLKLQALMTQDQPDGCWYGCSLSCCKGVDNFKPRTGPYQNQTVVVDGPEYETVGACASNIFIWDPKDCVELNFYCDTYGVDTISFGTTMAFLMECWENGVLTKNMTDGLDFTWGNADTALEILHQMSQGKGFGIKVGKGIRWLKNWLISEYHADPTFLHDIGMELKGLEYSEYISKESLAQQGGYSMALKGPQHDEAWLIFMDQINNVMPTFEQKAEALHYFPMWRTWFGLQGLCKLCWNDIIPESNKTAQEPAKVPEHVDNYIAIYTAITGKHLDIQELILQSERVYNFQKVFNLRMGKGKRSDDIPPYRAMGPVTEEEYLSRAKRYDQQIKDIIGKDPQTMTLAEKMKTLRTYREKQYDILVDSVYKRKGWDKNGVPTLAHLEKIKMDLPEVLDVINKLKSE